MEKTHKDTNVLNKGGRLQETFRQAKEEFRPALISSWFYVSIGLFFGFCFVILQYALDLLKEFLETNHAYVAWLLGAIALISEHLGIGLIVAAIAVFFYEWGAHIKKTMQRADQLVQAISQFEDIKSNVQRSDDLIGAITQVDEMLRILNTQKRTVDILAARGKDALESGLSIVICGPKPSQDEFEAKVLTDAVKNCRQLIFAIESLRVMGTWPNYRYIKFISDLLELTVGKNAEKFSMLYKSRTGEQHFIVPPNAAQMADAILATQMQAMGGGDNYDVISDLGSWHNEQLKKLHDATAMAIEEEEVCVRRVFNLYGIPRVFNTSKEVKDATETIRLILLEHLKNSNEWKGKKGRGNYEVRILEKDGFAKLRARYGADETAHFGLFVHGRETMVFKVTRPDLSDMALTLDPELIQRNRKIFDDSWNWAAPFPMEERTGDNASRRVREIVEQWRDDYFE